MTDTSTTTTDKEFQEKLLELTLLEKHLVELTFFEISILLDALLCQESKIKERLDSLKDSDVSEIQLITELSKQINIDLMNRFTNIGQTAMTRLQKEINLSEESEELITQ